MFPNNYNMSFSMPYSANMMGPGIGMTSGLRSSIGIPSRGGLFARLFGNTFGASRGINLPNILNTASRTLGVVNQAIPVVKQIGPLYNNMKSMLKVASLFKDETDPPKKNNNISRNNKIQPNTVTNETNELEKEKTITQNSYSNSPNFFI